MWNNQLTEDIHVLSQVILNDNHTSTNTEGPSGINIPADSAVFKTAWWLGSATDNNMGTIAYPAMDQIAPGMTPDGWADEGWYRLVQVSLLLSPLKILPVLRIDGRADDVS